MKIPAGKVFKILKKALKEWWAKDPFRESAVIAYYAIFSLPGLLVVILVFSGYFFGRDAVNNHIPHCEFRPEKIKKSVNNP
ncbi:MAG: hypothetical protein ACOCVA_02170 [Prolixibacteraceae bacterium]